MSPLLCHLSSDHHVPGIGLGALSRMQAVVHGECVSPRYLVHAGTAEPLRVSPPEAVAYLLELGIIGHDQQSGMGWADAVGGKGRLIFLVLKIV